MAKIIVTTCGTSLYQTSCWTYNNLSSLPLSSFTADRVGLLKRQMDCETDISNGVSTEELANSFDMLSWDNTRLINLPAELASLYVLKAALQSAKLPLGNGDKIVLLHSSNDEGKFCAEVIEKVLNNKLNEQISCSVELKQAEGLDPESATTFAGALKQIWTDYNNTIEELGDNMLILNLTGGYKATSMILTALAALKIGKIKIVYLHETANQQNDQLLCLYFKPNCGASEKLQVGLGTKDNNYGELASAFTEQ